MSAAEATKLSPRQARFVEEYLIDNNGSQAAIRAGYSATGARVAAHRLITDVAISSLIEARRQADATRLSINRENVLQRLLEAYEMAREQREPAVMVSAAREIAKMQGYYEPRKVHLAVDLAAEVEMGRLATLSDAELLKLIHQAEAAAGV